MSSASSLQKQLRNIGPKMANALYQAGITTPAKLRQLGAKEAYLIAYPNGDNYGDHNAAYLHALEGAIRDCDWKSLPKSVKQELQEFAADLQAKSKDPRYNKHD